MATNAVLTGAYSCREHGTLYTYDASWERIDGKARWKARIFYDRRLAEPEGEVDVTPNGDPTTAVLPAINHYIEVAVCSRACRSTPV